MKFPGPCASYLIVNFPITRTNDPRIVMLALDVESEVLRRYDLWMATHADLESLAVTMTRFIIGELSKVP